MFHQDQTIRERLMMLRTLLLLLALTLLGEATLAFAQQDTYYCTRWNRMANKPDLQRYVMGENVKKLDGRKVDQSCLLRQVDALVRWANRTCSDGTLDEETFAYLFIKEARKRCP